jgi:hypothetical protein
LPIGWWTPLRPRYRVDIEQRIYLDLGFIPPRPQEWIGLPDVLVTSGEPTGGVTRAAPRPRTPARYAELPVPNEVTERYLVVREVASGHVITVIEILSPSNKCPGAGRDEYERKRLQVLGSHTNLVEIDLIRAGQPLPMRLRNGDLPGDYRLVVSRARQRPVAEVYTFTLRDPIPDCPVPLLPADPEPSLPLNQLLHELYDRAGYDLAIHYDQPPDPPLSPEDQAWAESLRPAAPIA